MLWQRSEMSSQTPQAGGFLLMIGIFVGGWIGLQNGFLSLGLIAGTAGGVIAAALIWAIDRFRRRR